MGAGAIVLPWLPRDEWWIIADPKAFARLPFPVHDEPAALCPACGQPVGSGTLLDHSPDPPVRYTVGVLVRPDAWRDFAARYRCPRCVALGGVVRRVPGGWA